MTFRLRRQRRWNSTDVENEFALEVLRSGLLRVRILIGVITSALIFVLVMASFSPDEMLRAFRGSWTGFAFIVSAVGGANLLFLSFEHVIISRLIRTQTRAPEILNYISALIETSIPTGGMVVGAMFLGPVYTLFTPTLLVYPIFIVLSALRLDSKLSVFTGAVAGIEYAILVAVMLNQAPNLPPEPILTGLSLHLFKAFLLFATGVVTAMVTVQIKSRILKSFETVEERNRISRTFGEYVSPVVMDKLMTLKPDLRSERRSVCVMFLDIRNFTTFAEKRTPEEVVAYLESLFEFMIEIVNRHRGVINKFLGDGFMAVFGAPLSDGNDCDNAVAAALEIIERVEAEVACGNVLPTTVGIGLHAGEAVTGSIGSSMRKEYAVIGDVVNLASRIEQLNKTFGSQLLMSDRVWHNIAENVPRTIPIGDVHVKGREGTIQIYQVA